MQVTFSTLLKGAKVLKSAGTVSDKFNSLPPALRAPPLGRGGIKTGPTGIIFSGNDHTPINPDKAAWVVEQAGWI